MLTRLQGALLAQFTTSQRRANLVLLGLGALSALALPPLHVLPALFLAIPALLAAIEAAPTPRAAGRFGWWFGFGLNFLGLYWITEAILVEAARYWWLVPLAVPALAACLAFFVALPVALVKYTKAGWARVVGLAGAWTLTDIARQFTLSGFPWNLWGTVWAIPGELGDVLLQPAALIGVHGLGLFTLLLAGLPMLGRRGLPVGLLVIVGWAGFGLWRLHQPEQAAPGHHVVLVQGNVPQGEKWDRARAVEIFSLYLRLTATGVAGVAGGPVIVVWPEAASPFPLEPDQNARLAIASAASGHPVLATSVRWDAAGRPRNSIIPVLAGGALGDIYDKWHLVPFGEVQPPWFPLPIQLVPGGGFAPGPGPRTMYVHGVPPFGPLICYEAIFSGQIVDRANRPVWLVNVTNDAWFGNSAGPYQHLAAARLRAVEEGLPVLRAANTGISAAYDGFGRELVRLGLGQSGVVSVKLPGTLPPPYFARWGWPFSLLLALSVLTLSLVKRRIPRSHS